MCSLWYSTLFSRFVRSYHGVYIVHHCKHHPKNAVIKLNLTHFNSLYPMYALAKWNVLHHICCVRFFFGMNVSDNWFTVVNRDC